MSDLASLRGVNLSVRVLGQAIIGGAFDQNFSSEILDQASSQEINGQSVKTAVIGPPSRESQVLLQQTQTRGECSFEDYTADVRAACPHTCKLWPSLNV